MTRCVEKLALGWAQGQVLNLGHSDPSKVISIPQLWPQEQSRETSCVEAERSKWYVVCQSL